MNCHNYFADIRKFAVWYKKTYKSGISINAMLEEPFLSKLYVKMEEENEKRISKMSSGGKTSGNIHKESGHIQRLNDFPREEGQRSNAGKLGGAKNIETGWVKEFQTIGTDAAIKKLLDIKLNQIKELCHIMQVDTLYSYKELTQIVKHVKSRRLYIILECEEALPFIIKEKKGRLTYFKKINN